VDPIAHGHRRCAHEAYEHPAPLVDRISRRRLQGDLGFGDDLRELAPSTTMVGLPEDPLAVAAACPEFPSGRPELLAQLLYVVQVGDACIESAGDRGLDLAHLKPDEARSLRQR